MSNKELLTDHLLITNPRALPQNIDSCVAHLMDLYPTQVDEFFNGKHFKTLARCISNTPAGRKAFQTRMHMKFQVKVF